MEKTRLDVLLCNKNIAKSREEARAFIMSGLVFINNQKYDKCGEMVDEDSIVEYKGEKCKYVSRGGLKLEKAIECFNLNLENLVCADIGASTGGFSDCMLQNNAKQVFAVDVGYGQLSLKIREDERVIVLERVNARYIKPLHEKCELDSDNQVYLPLLDFVSVDVSFISLKLILPMCFSCLSDKGEAVVLIKPQFEAEKKEQGKKGVIKDKFVHLAVVKRTLAMINEIGFSVLGLTFSPIKGQKGNIEFLAYLSKDTSKNNQEFSDDFIFSLIDEANEI